MIDHSDAAPTSGGMFPKAGTPEWLALRRTGIGGSDAAAALGLSQWTSALELYMDKLGELPARDINEPMLWGQRLEPLVLQEYANRTHRQVVRPAAMFRSERHPFMLADFDGLADGRVVEAKTARSAEGWGEPGSDEVPLAYLLQVQHYMVVAAVPVADVAVLIGGQDFRVYEVQADPELQEMVIEGERQFWERVQQRVPPEVVSVEDARLRWGKLPAKGAVLATLEDIACVRRLHEAAERARAVVAAAEVDKAALMARLGERGDTLVDERGRPLVTWRLARAAVRFDAEAFEHEHPELYHSYMRPGTAARRFLLKDKPTEASP